MKNYITYFILLMSFTTSALTSMPIFASSKVDKLIQSDTTERLENITELKKSIRSLKVQMRTLELALVEAKKKKTGKRAYVKSKKVSDAIAAISGLGGAIAATFMEDKIRVLKITSFVFGISTSVSVIFDLLAEMSTDEAEIVQSKIDEVKPILKATESNLALEVKLLCKNEPSNQMCM